MEDTTQTATYRSLVVETTADLAGEERDAWFAAEASALLVTGEDKAQVAAFFLVLRDEAQKAGFQPEPAR